MSQCQLPFQEINDLEQRFAGIISNLVISFQNEVRVGKKIYDSQRAKMYGPYDKWHMIDCFVKVSGCHHILINRVHLNNILKFISRSVNLWSISMEVNRWQDSTPSLPTIRKWSSRKFLKCKRD